MELHARSKAVEYLSPHVISVSKKDPGFDASIILTEGKKRKHWHYYRDGVFIDVLPSQLASDDIKAINEKCDKTEGGKNRQVKNALSESLSRYFNTQAFHMNEAGPGQFPLISSMVANRDVSYHGIELDERHINTLKTKMKLSASDWDGVPNLPEGKPSVGVSVYALQFMVSRDLPQKLKSLISDDGFFVGNMYLSPEEKATHKQSSFFERALQQNKMGYVRLMDPACNANEYWIISKTTDTGNINDFAGILGDTLQRQRLAHAHRLPEQKLQ